MDLLTFGVANDVVGAESTVGFSVSSAISDVLITIAGDHLLDRQTPTSELVTSSVIMGLVPVDKNGDVRKESLLSSEGSISLLAKLVTCKGAAKLVSTSIDELLSR